jgi:hypothetical protein
VDNPEDLDDDIGLESLAVEENTGKFTLRTLWQWTCYQAAEQIGARAEQDGAAGRRGPSAGMYEARSRPYPGFRTPVFSLGSIISQL